MNESENKKKLIEFDVRFLKQLFKIFEILSNFDQLPAEESKKLAEKFEKYGLLLHLNLEEPLKTEFITHVGKEVQNLKEEITNLKTSLETINKSDHEEGNQSSEAQQNVNLNYQCPFYRVKQKIVQFKQNNNEIAEDGLNNFISFIEGIENLRIKELELQQANRTAENLEGYQGCFNRTPPNAGTSSQICDFFCKIFCCCSCCRDRSHDYEPLIGDNY